MSFETRTLKQLRKLAFEMDVHPKGDKRKRKTWIAATTQKTKTVANTRCKKIKITGKTDNKNIFPIVALPRESLPKKRRARPAEDQSLPGRRKYVKNMKQQIPEDVSEKMPKRLQRKTLTKPSSKLATVEKYLQDQHYNFNQNLKKFGPPNAQQVATFIFRLQDGLKAKLEQGV